MSGNREILEKYGVDAVLAITESDTFYLSGYQSSNCRILLTEEESFFFTDMRYLEEAEQKLGDRFEVRLGGMNEIKALAESCGVKRLGVEYEISHSEFCALEKLFRGTTLISVDQAFADRRAVKSEREISLIKSAQKVTETAFSEILHYIKDGVSEIEIAARLEYIMLKNGCELAFDSIVAFGENGSKPHAHRSGRKLAKGEFVTMDFGAKYCGYCSDMTRTVALGAVDDRKAAAYEAVLKANLMAEKAVRAGERCCDIDAVARNYLTDRGLGKFFSHSLGHSVGVDIHEMPAFSPSCNAVLKEGMVITVEPGVYLAGDFGLRIEDMVLVTQSGAEVLTHADKNLIVL